MKLLLPRKKLLVGPDIQWGICSPYHKSSNTSISSNSVMCEPYLALAQQSALALPAIPTVGKWYWEFEIITSSVAFMLGITNGSTPYTTYPGGDVNSHAWYSANGNKYTNGSAASYGVSAQTAGDVIGVQYDADGGNLYFRKNNTIMNSGTAAYTSLSGQKHVQYGQLGSGAGYLKFRAAGTGPNAVKYDPPAGYNILQTWAGEKVQCGWGADKNASNVVTFQNRGMLIYAGASRATRGVSTGKWYWETIISYVDTYGPIPGVGNASAILSSYPGADTNGWGYYGYNGQKYHNGNLTYGSTFTLNDCIGTALDMDGGTLTWYLNGVSQGVAYNSGITGTLFPMVGFPGAGAGHAVLCNFHKSQMVFGGPSGYSAIGGGGGW